MIRATWPGDEILCRTQAGQYVTVAPEEVDLIDVSPEQIWSVATAMIPFLEHDDANRALMGSNMQAPGGAAAGHRRARWSAPAWSAARRSTPATSPSRVRTGTVSYVDAEQIVIDGKDGGKEEYELQKFMRSNQGTLIHQKPIVDVGTDVDDGRRARRRLGDRHGRDGAGQEPARRLHVLGGLQLRGRDHPVQAPGRRTTSSPRSTSRSTRSTPARPSSATRRSPATSRTARRSRCATSTTAASSASAPRFSPATCSSARSRPRARPS